MIKRTIAHKQISDWNMRKIKGYSGNKGVVLPLAGRACRAPSYKYIVLAFPGISTVVFYLLGVSAHARKKT